MSQNVSHWWWTKVLTLKEIKNINKFVLKNYDGIEQRQYKASFSDGSLKKNTETLIIRYGKIKKYVAPLIEECMNRNRTSFGYDIYPISDRVLCDYNMYDSKSNGSFDWHVDLSPDLYEDVKLTVIINLSEKVYEGGDFYIQGDNDILVPELNQVGSMIMFPSFHRHKVAAVTKGLRKNLTFFLTGPNFK